MIINEVIRQIQQAENIALITHVQPDGDAIGSCLALANFWILWARRSPFTARTCLLYWSFYAAITDLLIL